MQLKAPQTYIPYIYHTPCAHKRQPIPHSHVWMINALVIGNISENTCHVIKKLDITIWDVSFRFSWIDCCYMARETDIVRKCMPLTALSEAGNVIHYRPKVWNILKPNGNTWHFWFAGNGLAPTTTKYCHFNAFLMHSVRSEKYNL